MTGVRAGDAVPNRLVLGGVCVAGPALVALIPMAAAPAMPSMAQYFAAGGDGQLFAQLVMTAPAIMLILMAPIAGMIAARYGRRPTLLASLVLFVLGGAGVLFVEHRAPLIAFRLLLGVAGGGLLTASLALIGEHFEDRAREKVLGFATAVSSLVAAAALIFGGGLVDLAGWRAPFALYLLGIPVLLAAWLCVPASGPRAPEARAAGAVRPGVAGPMRPMLPYFALLVLLTIGMFTPSIQVPFLLEQRAVTSAQLQGTIISMTAIVATLSAGAYGFFRRWIGVHGFLVIDAMCMGAGILTVALSTSVAGTMIGCALVGIGAGMSEPAIASLVFDRTPAYVHALAMGLIVSALNVGQFVNPLALAPLRGLFGITGSFLCLAAVLIAAGLLVLLRGRRDLVERPA